MFYTRWQIIAIGLACLVGVMLALPNIVGQNVLRFLPFERQIHLGLDLKGGSYLLLKVDTEAAERERLENVLDGVRRVLRTANILYTDLRIEGGAVRFKVRDSSRIDDARAALQPIVGSAAAPEYQITSGEGGELALTPTEVVARERANDAVARSIEIVRRRIDETGVNEPEIARQGTDRIVVQLPGVQDPDRLKRLLGTTAKLSFHLLSLETPAPGAPAPPGTEYLPGTADAGHGGGRYLVQRLVDVDGSHLTDAQAGTNSQNGEWVVNFTFDSVGAREFGAVTTKNVGRSLAIVLDNRVISAPVIREPIFGRGQISGRFTAAGANDLAILLRGGALPAPLKIIEERTVGPNLGADAIRTGIYACTIGGAFVVAFMIFFYRLFGVFASLGLVINLCMLMGLLSLLQASLTLPGIVGILLTVGMSVDANVLINERIREEARKGRGPVSAIQTGFSKAMSTIIDANLTTLLKMMILFMLGSGPVKGFAVTISLGIMTSMFTAIVVVRLFIALWLRRARPKALLA
ncbi:MAG TPA: protein translocase subunit SecD [Alphaproteobacteria bacterium]|nr:protein translocase subunit SecD [Alphaproteobacteria bacterium]